MGILFWVLAAYGAYMLYRQNTMRGLRTVRANMFLSCLEQGFSVENANYSAMWIDDKNVERMLIYAARNRYRHKYGGSQLKMIAAARAAGFKG